METHEGGHSDSDQSEGDLSEEEKKPADSKSKSLVSLVARRLQMNLEEKLSSIMRNSIINF